MKKPINNDVFFSEWSNWTDMKSYGPASRWVREMALDMVKLANSIYPVETVLDVGCGEGNITAAMARNNLGLLIMGTDVSSEAINTAKLLYGTSNQWFRHDPTGQEISRGNVSLMTAFEVLEHVEDWKTLLGTMADHSQMLLLSFPTGRMRAYEPGIGHYRNFKKGEVEAFLETKGYKPVKVRYTGFPFFSPLYREFCNATNITNSNMSKGKFGIVRKTASAVLYFLFRYCSFKNKGDQFIGLFIKTP